MADLNCTACDEIKQEVPSLVTNGLSSTMCASLKNDTGLKASSGNDDCEDLNNLNDCLVGNMETEIDRYDVCEWKPFSKKLIDNLYTTLKAMICAICGIWTNIHDLWTTIRSLCLKKSGNKIILYSNLGDHCSVTDSDTTYDLTKSGNKIILTGSDGSRDEVTDSNTTYDLTISGHTVHLNGSDGTDDSVTVPDNDTKYGLSRSGHTVTIVEGGTNTSVTIPDDDTWQPNTKSKDGYVEKGDGQANKVWKTDANGNPAWRDDVAGDIQCIIDYLSQGATFNVKESEQSDEAYVVLGKGCSLYNGDSEEHTADILLNYIAGGLLRLSGSIYFYSGTGTFTDAKSSPNFDNGYSMTTSQTRQKNPHWGVQGRPANGGELVYEIRLKKSQYPQIKKIYSGRGGESNSGSYDVHFTVFEEGDYAYGQHGWCHKDGTKYTDATPGYDNTYNSGHLVPNGWIYIQCRMHWINEMSQGDNKIYSPYGWLGIRIDTGKIHCD